MSVFTCTSRIKKEISADVDLSEYNNCKIHGLKPIVSRIFWGRDNSELSAKCPECSEDNIVFEGSVSKWNKFNPK